MPCIRKKSAQIFTTYDPHFSSDGECFFTITRGLMDKHGLHEWNIRINRESRVAGRCIYGPKVLSFSKYLVYNDEISIFQKVNTVLHEIAHALVGFEHDHNEIWRQKAIEIGCDGNQYHFMTLRLPTNVYLCPCQQLRLSFFNKTSTKRMCTICKNYATLQPKA